MFIEDEADAVFNEIRNQGKDNDDKEEPRSTTNDVMMAPAATETKPVSPAPAPLLTIKVDALSRTEDEMEDVELEEPVSPPACDPSEGPPLLFSQSIEVRNESRQAPPVLTSLSQELAAVIVKEKREAEDEVVLPQPVGASKAVPALIPLTVSEFGERPSVNPALHMSGGGVYTTDSYYRKLGHPLTTSSTSSTSTTSVSRPPQLSVIKKLPVSTPTLLPAKKRTVIRSKTAPAEENEKAENVLRQFYKKSNLITEAQRTIKLSDGLEITPIINVPTVAPSERAKKRSSESSDNDHTEGSKRARNDLVIEKIPRKNTEKEQAEQNNHQTNNEQALNCKLVISRLDKKAKLVFENGIEVPISKNIFKHIIPTSKPTTSQSNRIRRKTARARKISNAKPETNLEKEAQVTNDDSGNPEPLADMPLIVDSAKVEFPESCRATNSDTKAPVPTVGQHKLPCVVSQPSYQRWANRKTLAKSK